MKSAPIMENVSTRVQEEEALGKTVCELHLLLLSST